jgi:hypothetical protein
VTEPLVPAEAPFGVVIAAMPEHMHWVRGVCASIRHFMGDTPICLLLDGKSSTSDLQESYDLRAIDRGELEGRGLGELSGSTKAKLAALWVAPFDTFLFLDADTIVWGDVRRLADLDRFDFVLDMPIGTRRSRKAVMDANAARRQFPQFDALGHEEDYVNTGAFFARRGMLELGRYRDLVRFSQTHPRVFLNDQGIFNFMVFSGSDEGALRLDHQELQIKVGETELTELKQRFRFRGGRPLVTGAPVVIHWVGTLKPRVRERPDDFFEPMTFFRRQYRLALRGRNEPHALDALQLRFEDMICADWRGSNLRGRLRGLRRHTAKRSRYRLARIKVAVRLRTPDRVVSAVKRRTRSRAGSA